MGYSESIRAVQRVKSLLDAMVKTDTPIEFPSDEPAKLAYQIRDGIAVAEKRVAKGSDDEELQHYANLKTKFIVRSKKGKVYCEPRSLAPIAALKDGLNKMNLPDLVNPLQIVGAAITHKAAHMYFPDAELEDDDILKVFNWASKNNYYVVKGNEGITLTTDNAGELAWKPE